MQQKDYKAIAEIIALKGSSESQTTINYRRFLALKLADYFEKEHLARLERLVGRRTPKVFREIRKQFNKKQFLEDCGVEK